MKKLLGKLVVACLMIVATFTLITSLTTSQTYATNAQPTSNCNTFLGMNSWDCGLDDWNTESNIKTNIEKIIMNVGDAGVTIVGYVALGFIIYGGYLYMMSSGDPGKAMSGKKTITRAIIGLLIVALAKTIFGAILSAMGTKTQVGAGGEMAVVMHAINWVIGISGVVCAIFIVVGIYAIIGLVIVALSFIITNFVITRLANGQKGGNANLLESSIIAINNHNS